MDTYKQFAIRYDIDMLGVYPDCFFKASQCGKLLGLSNIHKSIRYFPANESITVKTKTNGGSQSCVYISIAGLKRLVSKSRKLEAQSVAKEIGMTVMDSHVVPIETATLDFIMRAFDGEQMTKQFKFGVYSVDLFFNDYNIVVECDEDNHKFAQGQDEHRQEYIECKFGCSFVRYRPQEKGDDALSYAINSIFKLILKAKCFDKSPK